MKVSQLFLYPDSGSFFSELFFSPNKEFDKLIIRREMKY